MDTKLKGDLAEQAAVLEALKRGWGVLRPLGDRLPYDLVFDVTGALVRLQVKYGWLDERTGNYVADTRRTKTNRRRMVRASCTTADFDFALVYVEEFEIFYVIPVSMFVSYGSGIHLVEAERRQRRPRSAEYRDAWNLIPQWAAREETRMRTPVKFGEAAGGVIPSQAPIQSEKV
jgi:PD-(D/E)XK nuclease superfamily protein